MTSNKIKRLYQKHGLRIADIARKITRGNKESMSGTIKNVRKSLLKSGIVKWNIY